MDLIILGRRGIHLSNAVVTVANRWSNSCVVEGTRQTMRPSIDDVVPLGYPAVGVDLKVGHIATRNRRRQQWRRRRIGGFLFWCLPCFSQWRIYKGRSRSARVICVRRGIRNVRGICVLRRNRSRRSLFWNPNKLMLLFPIFTIFPKMTRPEAESTTNSFGASIRSMTHG